MFGKTVDLSQAVIDFVSKEDARKDKIRSLISELERSVQETNAEISTLNDALIECQMNEDAAGAAKFRDQIRNLRLTLTGVQGERAGLQKQLEISPSRQKELSKIRETAVKAEKERHETLALMRGEREKLELQKKELEKKIADKSSEINHISNRSEASELHRIMQYIDPRAPKLPYFERDAFLTAWIRGEQISRFFKDPEPHRGPTITYGPEHRHGYSQDDDVLGTANVPSGLM